MSFDDWAPWYRRAEFLLAGGLLQRSRVRFLRQLRAHRRVLLLGEGPGRFLEAFVQCQPRAEVTCVDSSQRMLEEAASALRKRHPTLPRVEWIQADARVWKPTKTGYDLIVTHFFLDCFTSNQLAELIPRIASWSTADAVWLLADFRVPSKGFRRWRARRIHAWMYSVFRRTTSIHAHTLADPSPHIAANGFDLEARMEFSAGLVHTELWRRRTLKALGE